MKSVLDSLAKQKTLDLKDYSFYWSKKSPSIAAAIYQVFLPNEGVILDPFIGSGSSLYGLRLFENQHKFIGVDVNQLPIELVHFNMQQMSEDSVKKVVSEVTEFIKANRYVYEYHLDESIQPYVLKKAYIDRTDEGFNPTYFHFERGKEKLEITSASGQIFEKTKQLYRKRTLEHLVANKKLPDLVLGKNSRIAIKDGMKMSDIFSPINFTLLTRYRNISNDSREMAIVLSSCLHLCRMTDTKSQSQFPYWVPKTDAVDRNVLDLLHKKLKELVKFNNASRKLNMPKRVDSFTNLVFSSENAYLMLHKPIQNVTTSQIPDSSVDLVFTDPPYFDQVAYSEYLVIWEFFTGLTADLENEIVQSNREKFASDRVNYLKMMESGFQKISQKLKENHLAIIFFKDSKLTNVLDFLKVMQNSKLEYLTQIHVSKPKFTYKQNTSQKSTVEGDSLYVFRKNSTLLEYEPKSNEQINLQESILHLIDGYLLQNGPATASKILDDCVIPTLWKSQLLHLITDETVFQGVVNGHYEVDRETRQVIGRL